MARLLGCLLVLGTAVIALPNVWALLLLAPYLAAFLYARTHISAVAMGFAAALLWLDFVVLVPPVPSTIGLALVFAAAGALGTAWITHSVALSVHTAATAALCVSAFAWLLLTDGPARFGGVNPLSYLWLLLVGAVLFLAQCGIQLREQRRGQRGAVAVGEHGPTAPAQLERRP